jgi:hypothetical protein
MGRRNLKVPHSLLHALQKSPRKEQNFCLSIKIGRVSHNRKQHKLHLTISEAYL